MIVAAVMWPGFALIADGRPLSEAMSRSFEAGKADVGGGIIFVLVFGLLMLASAIPCGLGLFATLPMGYMTAALMYRDMIGMPSASGRPVSPQPGYQPGVWPPAPNSDATPSAAGWYPTQQPASTERPRAAASDGVDSPTTPGDAAQPPTAPGRVDPPD